MIKAENLRGTFLELVKIPNPSKEEREVCDFIVEHLRPHAASIAEDDAAGRIGGNCNNLFVEIKGGAPGGPTILINAHMDSVNPIHNVKPVEDGDTIRSDGTTVLGADDKAGIAIILEIVRALHEQKLPHGSLQLLFTVSEETGLAGAKSMDTSLLRADFGYAVDGGAPAGTIIHRSPNHDKLTATVRGRAAHAGIDPERGVHAIRAAAVAIAGMPMGRIDEDTTANIGVIRGGSATNVVPAEVYIEGEARSHDEGRLKAQIEKMKKHIIDAAGSAGGGAEIKVEREYNSFDLPPDSPIIKRFTEAAERRGVEPTLHSTNGGFDANILNANGVPAATVCNGASNPHSTDEFLSIEECAASANILLDLITHAAG